MNIRKRIEYKIMKKQEEIQEYQAKINEAEAFIEGLKETLKYVPRNKENGSVESKIRPGSAIFKTVNFLKKVGHPTHIDEILEGIGKPNTKKAKVALSGSLGWYVRRKEIFIRPAPNTFGLIGMEESEEPPDDFGRDNEEPEEQNKNEIEPF